MKLALLGRKLGHSYSAVLHRGLGGTYDLVEVEPECLSDYVARCTLDGFNVTVPYKRQIVPYLAALSPLAARLGAVNTVKRQADGWHGYNTDYEGLRGALAMDGVALRGQNALVLGTGGASQVAQAVLADGGANVTVVSRQGPIDYDNCYRLQQTQIVVNATPVGTYPDTNAPLDLARFAQLQYVFDLVYNPYRTALLLQAQSLGVAHRNGLAMLVIQALAARRIWLGTAYTQADVATCMARLQQQTRNIALVGMPSCGKSTLGRLLAKALGMPWLDTDAMIADNTGSSPAAIIEKQGEPAFRAIERQQVEAACARRGVVISLGGGAVLHPDNRLRLRQTAFVVWVRRNLADLNADNRPTLQALGAAEMYRIRQPLYAKTADFVVDNNNAVDDTLGAIMRAVCQQGE